MGPKTYSMAAVGPTASPKVSEEQRTRQGSQWGCIASCRVSTQFQVLNGLILYPGVQILNEDSASYTQ